MSLTVLIILLKGWYSCKVVFANGNGNMVETGNKIKSLIWTTISKIEWANRKFTILKIIRHIQFFEMSNK